jgi:hypothetical protein
VLSDRDFIREIEHSLSLPRLAGYRHPADEDGRVSVQRYVWNTALSESLYPVLQGVEIALRNSIDVAATQTIGDGWLLDACELGDRECAQVVAVTNQLSRERSSVDHHAIVARLSFGFWTSLLSDPYEGVLWPRAAGIAFEGAPRRYRSRVEMSRRANAARRLRNRISHHEPIWHWRDLDAQYDGLREILSWLSPSVADCISIIDRFETVYAAGWQQYSTQVEGLADMFRE